MTTPLEEKLMKEFDELLAKTIQKWAGDKEMMNRHNFQFHGGIELKQFLSHAISQVREECVEGILKSVEGLKPPIKVMQDGVSFDYSFAEGFNDALTDIKSLLLESIR